MMMLHRPREMKIGERQIQLPSYFPSISSVKTALSPLGYVLLLSAMQTKQYLVSAFDLCYANDEDRKILKMKMSETLGNGSVVLLDSGNYESYWKGKSKSWTQEDFHRTLADTNCTFAFCYDEQMPPEDFATHVKLICDRNKEDRLINKKIPIIPIIHGRSEELPSLCSRVADLTDSVIVAVPERRLGKGIFARAKCISEIRQALNTTGRYVALHLLGTGNPISIAIYSLAGADIYDGLEWCQTTVDHETATTLYHFTQADFFQKQTAWGEMNLDFQSRTLAHNLEFYQTWMNRLFQSVHDNQGIEFCKRHFPERIYSVCEDILRGFR